MKPLNPLVCISCLVLCFCSGWVLRGLFDQSEKVTHLVYGFEEFNEHEELKEASKELYIGTAVNNLDDNSQVQRLPDIETTDHFLTNKKSLVESILDHMQRGQLQAVYQLFLEQDGDASRFNANDINLISSLFYQKVLDTGLDNYIESDLLLSLGEIIISMDAYSPYAQFFKVVANTNQQPALALSDLDELSSYYQEQISERQLQLLENWVLNQVEKNLYALQDWSGLDEWFSILAARAADPSDVYRRQAALQFEQGRFIESLESLDLVSNYASWSEADEHLYKRNRESIDKEDVVSLQLERLGEHYIASLELNNNISVKLLMDTGASISALDYRFVALKGLKASGSVVRLSTASGVVESELLDIYSVNFGGYHLQELEFASIDLGGGQNPYQGLLGMDILGQFEFYLDQRDAILYLNQGKGLNESLFGF